MKLGGLGSYLSAKVSPQSVSCVTKPHLMKLCDCTAVVVPSHSCPPQPHRCWDSGMQAPPLPLQIPVLIMVHRPIHHSMGLLRLLPHSLLSRSPLAVHCLLLREPNSDILKL